MINHPYSYQTTAVVIGITLALGILVLVRRDHLQLRRALFWLVVALCALVLGVWPQLADHLAVMLGVTYAPTLVLTVGVGVLSLKLLLTDLSNSRMERDLRRLNQRLAMLELDIESAGGESARSDEQEPTP